jgi:hypothetical protein
LNVEAKYSIDKRFDKVMNKLSHMTEVMMVQKNPEQNNPNASQHAAKAMGCEAKVEARNAGGKNKEVVREEGEWSGGGMPV